MGGPRKEQVGHLRNKQIQTGLDNKPKEAKPSSVASYCRRVVLAPMEAILLIAAVEYRRLDFDDGFQPGPEFGADGAHFYFPFHFPFPFALALDPDFDLAADAPAVHARI